MLYACDATWWHEYPEAQKFRGRKFTIDESCVFEAVQCLGQSPNIGLSFDPQVLHTGQARLPDKSKIFGGGNSGYQAVNLAVHLGARQIILLGFDMKAGPKGQAHHHGAHPRPMNNPTPDNYVRWAAGFWTMLADLKRARVKVINCTPGSALDCFPKAELWDVL